MNSRTLGLIGAGIGGVLGAVLGLLADPEDVGLWIAVGIALGAALSPYLTNRP